MNQNKVLKRYTGIKWILLLLVASILVSLVKGNLLFTVALGCVLFYFVYLKKKYKLMLTDGKKE